MILFQGLGYLVFLIWLAVMPATEWATDALNGPDTYPHSPGAQFVGFLLSSIAITVAALIVRRRRLRAVVYDVATRQAVSPPRRDTFFFIPMLWWGPITLVAGTIFVLASS